MIGFERVVDAFVAAIADGSRVGRIGANTSFVFGSELPAVVIVVVHGVVELLGVSSIFALIPALVNLRIVE
ncbi:hypothetical protein [Natrinema sp. SYSU A 869]|uniref:hypothetical protein n=1 Tax=Natrinema sp. SYSU A 869 TaxID=2871694 RepID=UPI001CA419B5|nr:hypothetical protein [Natrinema sp. SYSU A 869]